jgi:cell division protein FtsB
LSGTVETERQIAELKQSNEELRKQNEELRKQNERLAELESKIDGSFSKHGIYSAPVPKSKQP